MFINFLFLFIFSIFCEQPSKAEMIDLSAKSVDTFDSFNEVERRLNLDVWHPENQWGEPQDLPAYGGLLLRDLVILVVNSFKNMIGSNQDLSEDWDFAIRSRELFTDSSNFNPKRQTKLLHPRGVCVSGEWRIFNNAPKIATGLFSPGTQVPAVLRLSSGTHASERLYENQPQERLFGMAIKLFHSKSPNEPAITSNILTLDQQGFARSKRPYMLTSQDDDIFFTNVSPGQGFLAQTLSAALDIFDKPNFARPVYVTAGIDDRGENVEDPIVPFEVRFVPQFQKLNKNYDDFRLELLDYKSGSFDIVIEKLGKNDQAISERIGEIQLQFPMQVSGVCDLMLSFHHSPNQWKGEYQKK